MNIINKKRLIVAFMVLLILTNFYQFIKITNYKKLTERNDNEFRYTLVMIYNSIESIEEKRHDEIVDMAALSSAIGQSYAIYNSTSYYSKNKLLHETLRILNDNISNRTNIQEVLDENDLNILNPLIKKVKDNPLDNEATEELLYLVRKHTVIGSPLP
ncbi:hypothetical protein ACH36K_15135 [Clostridium sp. MB05]|uniref:hypothetical protein n=1 Tax=Clostridium sp. MB05 TaxID=3376682 RepID=UPI0039822432